MGDGEFFLLGVIAGFVSGFIPGLHPNTLISVLSSFGLDRHTFALLIISLYPANLISSYVPAIFFGIPENGTVISVLPGQRMVLEGRGLQALKVVIFSTVIAVLLSVGFLYFSLDFFSVAYSAIKEYMKWILLVAVLILLIRTKKPHLAIFVFLASGLLGKFSLGSDMADPFLPLFSGMFALAAIMNYKKSSIPEQKDESIKFSFAKFTLIGVVLGVIADMVPGIGSPSQMATFATVLMPINTFGYMAMTSSISASQAIFALATSVSIGKSRIGAIASLAEAIKINENLFLLITLFVLSMAISVILVYAVRKQVAKLARIDFSKINFVIAIYLFIITFLIDGWLGCGVLCIGGVLGWLTVRLGVERTMLMGSIILPTLLLLFRIFWL